MCINIVISFSSVFAWEKVGSTWKVFLNIWNSKKDINPENEESLIKIT